jgi:hypothetical protein
VDKQAINLGGLSVLLIRGNRQGVCKVRPPRDTSSTERIASPSKKIGHCACVCLFLVVPLHIISTFLTGFCVFKDTAHKPNTHVYYYYQAER